MEVLHVPEQPRRIGPWNAAAIVVLLPPLGYWAATVLGLAGIAAPSRLLIAQVPMAARVVFVVLCPVVAMGLADVARRRVVAHGAAGGGLATALMAVGGVMALLSVLAVLQINKLTHSSASDTPPHPYAQSALLIPPSAAGAAVLDPAPAERLV